MDEEQSKFSAFSRNLVRLCFVANFIRAFLGFLAKNWFASGRQMNAALIEI
jgi:hypothetical protein